ncbi:MAG: hypothetical protein ACXACG_18955 [Candidatus Thorarchaeota archaeon]|jgi:hypothetical protein
MISRKMLLVSVAIGLLMLSLTSVPVRADVEGKTYYYSATYYQESTQVDNDPEYDYSIKGDFRVYVYNISEVGGDDVINYNYQGYVREGVVQFYVDHNDSVDFQDHKVYWDISTSDTNSNNRSESTGVAVFPQDSWMDWGERLFVNPIWSTHDSDWNDAIADTEADNSSTLITESIGDGRFAFQIEVMMEDLADNLNGTRTYTYSSSFDEDGVLLEMSFSEVTSWENENMTLGTTRAYEYIRTTGLPGGGLNLSMDIPLVVAAGIGVAALIVGLLIGRRLWA